MTCTSTGTQTRQRIIGAAGRFNAPGVETGGWANIELPPPPGPYLSIRRQCEHLPFPLFSSVFRGFHAWVPLARRPCSAPPNGTVMSRGLGPMGIRHQTSWSRSLEERYLFR